MNPNRRQMTEDNRIAHLRMAPKSATGRLRPNALTGDVDFVQTQLSGYAV
jgi:hypothetical protein